MSLDDRFSRIAKRFPVVAICQYDARKFDGSTLLEALKIHTDNFEQQLGSFLN
ncbi:MAG TPA: MEDS domain-containing protein [Candidatus Dormibacteraeota bacterium]|nr:MEDS domain-containing protein [Candidatus Dormibacteraeota bacterium]